MSEKYSHYDFSESLERASFKRDDVESVLLAWGYQGDYAEWTGGFVCKLKDGRWVHLIGWCDTTGWGCQDGIEEKFFDHEPTRDELTEGLESWQDESKRAIADANTNPPDLNRFVRGEIDEWGNEVKQP